MNSTEVREALLGRWPAGEYLHIPEAPMHSDRSGRKLDVVVVSTWRSRGLALDGVEIKVSMSDWKRELDRPDKADWWWNHVDRFWIAAPADVAKKIKPQLPVNWGLLSCAESGVRVSVTPEPNRKRVPFTWPETVGLLRATAGISTQAIAHAREQGRQMGRDEAVSRAAAGRPLAGADERRASAAEGRLSQLQAAVDAFEEASGVKIGGWAHDAGRIGHIVAAVRAGIIQGPEQIDSRIAREVETLRSIADTADLLRKALAEGFATPEPVVPPSLFAEADQ